MALLEHLSRIQKKPLHIRRRWHIGISASITLVIALVWVGTLSNTIRVAYDKEEKNKAPSPFAIFKNDLVAGVDEVREGFVIIRDNFKE